MGLKKTELIECTCDVCGAAMHPNDTKGAIAINGGDGRDVGPSEIFVSVRVEHPYKCTNGFVCKSCQKEWLQRYINAI